MKNLAVLGMILALLLVFGCISDVGTNPDLATNQVTQSSSTPLGKTPGLPDENCEQPQYYSFSETDDWNEGMLNLIKIDTRTGSAKTIWKLGIPSFDPVTGEPLSPFGLTFDVDGTMYTIIDWLGDFTEGSQKSRLARVDLKTGAVTFIGDFIHLSFAGPEMDTRGNIYATSFTVGDPATGGIPPYIWGDNCLYRFNKRTGAATRIGNTGRGDWMDLAFDSKGNLWATTKNKLFILSTRTGAATFVKDIKGVPNTDQHIAGIPPEDWPYMEVMSIAFDEHDVLWATAMRGFSPVLGNGLVLKIDVKSGQAHIVGYTGKSYNHGGDILFAKDKW